MSENTDLAYYQKNRYVVLSKAKDYYKIIKIDQGNKQEINTETCLKKKKIKKENMEKTDITRCLKRRKQD